MTAHPSSPLAEYRQAASYTQESFAENLGVDRTTIGRWERGVQSPQPWQRPDLAAALDISLDHLDDMLRRTKRPRTRLPRLRLPCSSQSADSATPSTTSQDRSARSPVMTPYMPPSHAYGAHWTESISPTTD